MLKGQLMELKASGVCSVKLSPGQRVRITNGPGDQVVDTWAFNADDPAEFMGMEHCRAWWLKLIPEVAADTSAGEHDTVIACCNPDRYRVLGAPEGHANCQENLHAELATHGVTSSVTPCPLNLWMNIPPSGGNKLGREQPTKIPGAYVELEALTPAIVVFSACPMDVLPINGEDGPKDGVTVEVV